MSPQHLRPAVLHALFACCVAVGACSRAAVPDPRPAAREYAAAAKRGDADALHAMLSESAQRRWGKDGTRRLVADAKQELVQRGKALDQTTLRVEATARTRFADGEDAVLVLEDGAIKVGAAGLLPAGARTPEQALGELRQALARRNYSGLMQVLTRDARSAVESDMRSLVEGLEQPATLDVRVTGDSAEVSVPGGHMVKLKREAGVWRVEDFD